MKAGEIKTERGRGEGGGGLKNRQGRRVAGGLL